MIRFARGNIFHSGCEALVNPVNCVGVMGKGLALQFKQRFPTNFASYAKACRAGELVPGRMHLFDTGSPQPHCIINFPTKRHWRDASRLDDVAHGLAALARLIAANDIRSTAVPPLGCGLGGLPWHDVCQLIDHHLSPLDSVDIAVYGPAPG